MNCLHQVASTSRCAWGAWPSSSPFAACTATLRRRAPLHVRAEAVSIPSKFSKVVPKGDRVLVKVAEQEEKTRGGILLPSSAQKRPTSGEVVALGDGRAPDGKTRPFTLEVGNTVLYSKFGFMYTDLQLQGEEYILIREEDVIDAQADDIPELAPVGDRILIKIEDTADVTIGGVVLPDSAKERPLSGTVVRTGPGTYDAEKEPPLQPLALKAGDRVVYFKYAGDNMETPSGEKFVVLREDDVLAKA